MEISEVVVQPQPHGVRFRVTAGGKSKRFWVSRYLLNDLTGETSQDDQSLLAQFQKHHESLGQMGMQLMISGDPESDIQPIPSTMFFPRGRPLNKLYDEEK